MRRADHKTRSSQIEYRVSVAPVGRRVKKCLHYIRLDWKKKLISGTLSSTLFQLQLFGIEMMTLLTYNYRFIVNSVHT